MNISSLGSKAFTCLRLFALMVVVQFNCIGDVFASSRYGATHFGIGTDYSALVNTKDYSSDLGNSINVFASAKHLAKGSVFGFHGQIGLENRSYSYQYQGAQSTRICQFVAQLRLVNMYLGTTFNVSKTICVDYGFSAGYLYQTISWIQYKRSSLPKIKSKSPTSALPAIPIQIQLTACKQIRKISIYAGGLYTVTKQTISDYDDYNNQSIVLNWQAVGLKMGVSYWFT